MLVGTGSPFASAAADERRIKPSQAQVGSRGTPALTYSEKSSLRVHAGRLKRLVSNADLRRGRPGDQRIVIDTEGRSPELTRGAGAPDIAATGVGVGARRRAAAGDVSS